MDFKVGDRVRVLRCSAGQARHEDAEGEVVSLRNGLIDVKVGRGDLCEASKVEALPGTATPFKKGDRVRVVLEGPVNYVGENGFSLNEYPHYISNLDPEVSIEKIAPALPTTPGSVIQTGQTDLGDPEIFWVLAHGDCWYGRGYDTRKPAVFQSKDVEHYEVIFDAGAK